MAGPLHGVRVLELARILAGPWAGQLLADLGADVIKVERPGAGDDTRHWGPPFVAGTDGERLSAAYFHSCNRGKRSIAVDFETPEGREVVRRLAGEADVVIENFRVGALKRHGLDHDSLSDLNPRLVTCSITGFGQDGPYASRAGYDFLIQGMGGLMSVTGDAEGQPTKVGMAVIDLFTGLYAAVGILAALRHRDRTGEGQHVDCALLDTAVATLANQALNYLVGGRAPGRLGNAHPNIVPYEVFPVSDGHVIIATGNDGQYARLCVILGAPELARDPRFADNAGRVAHRRELIPKLCALTLGSDKAGLLSRLEAEGVPAGPINAIDEVFADPQVIARGLRIDIARPEAQGGTVPGVRAPLVLSGTPMDYRSPPPLLGEHTDEIMSALGRAAGSAWRTSE
jgi:crotonobetainyl-CoA:carnitine CoA-transferase CaiB-like acyl-CoA transferase